MFLMNKTLVYQDLMVVLKTSQNDNTMSENYNVPYIILDIKNH